MEETRHITVIMDGKKAALDANAVLYVLTVGRSTELHLSDGTVRRTRMTLTQLEKELGERFLKIHRGCLVSAMAIHNVTDSVNLSNGESLSYTLRKRNQIIDQLCASRRSMMSAFDSTDIPATREEYQEHYSSFEHMHVGFADIEMIFDEEKRAVGWIFCYGNQALERLGELASIGENSFGSLLSGGDSRWLRAFERATLYGDTVEIAQADAGLRMVCFPTFPGHCGCLLFNVSQLQLGKLPPMA